MCMNGTTAFYCLCHHLKSRLWKYHSSPGNDAGGGVDLQTCWALSLLARLSIDFSASASTLGCTPHHNWLWKRTS